MNRKLFKILITLIIIITIAGAATLYFLLKEDKAEGDLPIEKAVQFSYTTEEIKTDLKDNSYVLIQFQFFTDSKKATEELIQREFQVKNEFIKQSIHLTEGDFQSNLEEIETSMKDAMNLEMENGEILDVLIVNKVIQ
ncbi:flagellar FliL protein [Gracilibacillus halotolerans]|uniref:Flagellar FliL protein n=1 Tax=Gracilibacillus halotolerans TaxID=74386 RepID=A0A841RIY1_9BACI|nr:flagellar basal body-associated protein FliL [Gracilibacillus halotolerans]MBB6511446.1 flagellar FliL protein [Gracilibacillus halotolerans]